MINQIIREPEWRRRGFYVAVVQILAGQGFEVEKSIPGGIDRLVKIERTKEGKRRLTAKEKNIVAVVEAVVGVPLSMESVRHVYFLRAENANTPIEFAQPIQDKELRKKLKKEGRKRTHALGGLWLAVVTTHERMVADYGDEGTHGWIISSAEYKKFRVELASTQSAPT